MFVSGSNASSVPVPRGPVFREKPSAFGVNGSSFIAARHLAPSITRAKSLTLHEDRFTSNI